MCEQQFVVGYTEFNWAHAHASFISTTTKLLPDSATNTDYDTLTLTALAERWLYTHMDQLYKWFDSGSVSPNSLIEEHLLLPGQDLCLVLQEDELPILLKVWFKSTT